MIGNDPGPLGQSFEDFLIEQGIRDEVYGSALDRVLAWQFKQDVDPET